MTLAEYLASTDRNIFWRLSSGEHLNLLNEALEQIRQLQADLAATRAGELAYLENLAAFLKDA